jgi:HK97 family phage prohead protease
MKRKFIPSASLTDSKVGERQIRVVASTPTPDRVKDVMVAEGCDLTEYRANPIVLANHNPACPIGTADVEIKNGRVEATITFAPAGASAKADEYCALAKAGVLNAVSVGFETLDAEPIRGGGERVKSWSLLELSLVSVPANPEAVVTARSLEKADAEKWKVGASRNLPLDEESDWDGAEAEKSIFEKADFDGDDPDTVFARKGFLVYDSVDPAKKGSYKLPFAKVVDGRLTAVAAGIRAAASRLKQADIPDDVAEKARGVIDHYEAKMKSDGKSAPLSRRVKAVVASRRKGMYDLNSLSYVVQQLVSLALGADWERDYEGDDSDLPEILAEIARSAGEAFIAMSEEETREALASLSDLLPAEQKSYVAGAPSRAAKLLRAAALRAKAGRRFSSDNEKCIKGAMEQIKSAHETLDKMLSQASDEDEGEEEQSESDTDAGALKALTWRERDVELLRLANTA